MQRGDRVKVRLLGGEVVNRIVLQVSPCWIYACRAEAYADMQTRGLPEPERSGRFPGYQSFPSADVWPA